MPRKTKLIIAEGFQVLDIGHLRSVEDIAHLRALDPGIVDDIGHLRSVEDIGHARMLDSDPGLGHSPVGDIGHGRTLGADIAGDLGHRRGADDIGHLRTVLDLNEPHIVRRVTVHRGADGHIHLVLEE
jgi:hypothetical protein